MYERPSYQYFLGDIINIEATVRQYFHVPLRVYVDRCVATLSPDMSSNPRYAFIESHGWGSLMSWLMLFCSVKIANDQHKNLFANLWCYFTCSSACRCLVDGIITGSDSKFMARTADYKLQFQLEAFRFQGAESGMVSIFKTDLVVPVIHKMQQNYI